MPERPNFDEMTHPELAQHADKLRAAKELAVKAGMSGDPFDEELAELNTAARRRPQRITGSMG